MDGLLFHRRNPSHFDVNKSTFVDRESRKTVAFVGHIHIMKMSRCVPIFSQLEIHYLGIDLCFFSILGFLQQVKV